MPEIKVILYVIGGIGYFVYSVYKKNKEAQEEKALAERKRRTEPPIIPQPAKPITSTYTQPKAVPGKSESFEDYNKRITAKPVAPKASKPLAKPAVANKPKQFLVTDEGASFGGEGTAYEQKYTRPITSEERIHDEISRSAITSESEIQDETHSINVREALIGSFIFERKF